MGGGGGERGGQSKFCMVFIIPDIGISFKEFLKCIRYFLIIGKTKVSFMWFFEQEKIANIFTTVNFQYPPPPPPLPS